MAAHAAGSSSTLLAPEGATARLGLDDIGRARFAPDGAGYAHVATRHFVGPRGEVLPLPLMQQGS